MESSIQRIEAEISTSYDVSIDIKYDTEQIAKKVAEEYKKQREGKDKELLTAIDQKMSEATQSLNDRTKLAMDNWKKAHK